MSVFDRYAPFVQDFIYAHEWENLRGVQVAAGEAIFGTDDHVLPVRLHGLRQDRGGLLPHPDRVLGEPARLRGRPLHRPHQGADQRPVLSPHRPLRGGGDQRLALARGRLCLAQGTAREAAVRHPADHAGIPRGAAHAPPRCGVQALLRPALRRDRRGPLAAAPGPRRPVPLPHRASGENSGRAAAAHRPLRHDRRPRGRGRLPRRRHRAQHDRPPHRGAPAHLAPLDGALLPDRPAGGRVRASDGRRMCRG